jgi:hypothetical protein
MARVRPGEHGRAGVDEERLAGARERNAAGVALEQLEAKV